MGTETFIFLQGHSFFRPTMSEVMEIKVEPWLHGDITVADEMSAERLLQSLQCNNMKGVPGQVVEDPSAKQTPEMFATPHNPDIRYLENERVVHLKKKRSGKKSTINKNNKQLPQDINGRVLASSQIDNSIVAPFDGYVFPWVRSQETGIFMCTQCTYKTPRKGDVVKHVRKHTGEKPYYCSGCDYSASESSRLRVHERTHTGERPFPCSKCPYSALRKGDLVKHEKTHKSREGDDEKPMAPPGPVYKCTECNYDTGRKGDLVKHSRIHAGGRTAYPCSECVFTVVGSGGVVDGSQLVGANRRIGDKRKFECSQCGYRTSRRGDMMKHTRTHTGERPFFCTQCDYTATERSRLKAHEKTHTGIRPFSCSMCNYSAFQKSDVVKHERKHTGEKPYRCSTCEYSASERSRLKAHERTHTRQGALMACSQCGYSTSRKGDLTRHEKSHNVVTSMYFSKMCQTSPHPTPPPPPMLFPPRPEEPPPSLLPLLYNPPPPPP